jgi:protein SCO1
VAERRPRRLRACLAGALALVGLVLAGCGSGSSGPAVTGVQVDDHGYHGSYLSEPYVVPDVALPDTAGKPYSLAKATAPVKIVFFGYTHCPDICQVVMSTIATAVARLDAGQRADVQVVFVTTDPARDTGPVLRTYLDRLNPSFVGVTGDLNRIMALAKPLKVYVAKGQKLPSGGYEVDHATYVFGIAGTQARVVWSQDTSPAQLATDIIKLLKSAPKEPR